MNTRLPAPDLGNVDGALRTEHTVLLDLVISLSTEQWNAPSRAAGWSVADVVGHVGATAHQMYMPAGILASRGPSLETANEGPVEVRRAWTRERVVVELVGATRTASRMLTVVRHTPLRAVPMQLNELGRYPMALLVGGALVFDLHTHVRHDIAPALGLHAPPTDARRMRAVLDWMTAVLSRQTAMSPTPGFDAGLSLTLTGSGGGTWWVDAHGLAEVGSRTPAALVAAAAISFPDWGTQRSSWRDADVEISGDAGLAARYLDTVNVV